MAAIRAPHGTVHAYSIYKWDTKEERVAALSKPFIQVAACKPRKEKEK